MSPSSFVDWLSGFLEASGQTLTEEQQKKIRDKLEKVKTAVPEKTLDQQMAEWLKSLPQTPTLPYVPYTPLPSPWIDPYNPLTTYWYVHTTCQI